MKAGDVVLLENVRYYNEEEANDPAFAEKLAKVADVYVNDAFGAAHRAHASTEGVARVVAKRGGQCAAGLLMERELKFLGDELENPARPFVVILGGAKVSDKIKVIDRLLEKADTILIGGAMAYTFRLAQGYKVGKSLVRTRPKQTALEPRCQGQEARGQIRAADRTMSWPRRSTTDKLNKKGKPVIDLSNIRTDHRHETPGRCGRASTSARKTAAHYAEIVFSAKTILWNGPMGMFEDKRFAEGTNAVARAVAEATQKHGAKSIIGGGDSVKALNKAKLGDKVTFMSTGGGASLEFLKAGSCRVAAATSEPGRLERTKLITAAHSISEHE